MIETIGHLNGRRANCKAVTVVVTVLPFQRLRFFHTATAAAAAQVSAVYVHF